MSDISIDDLKSVLGAFLKDRTVYTAKISSGIWQDMRDNHVLKTPDSVHESLDTDAVSVWEACEAGDVVIAYEQNGDTPYFYGIGVVANTPLSTFSLEWPRKPEDMDRDYKTVYWVTIAGNGERFDAKPIDSPPSEEFAIVEHGYLWKVMDAASAESMPPSTEELLHRLVAADRLRDVDTLLDEHLPDTWNDAEKKGHQIRAVVLEALLDRGSKNSIQSDRQFAQGIIAHREEVTEGTIGDSCGRRLFEDVDGVDEFLENGFDPALSRIEDNARSFSEIIENRHGGTMSEPDDSNYFILRTGTDLNPETPTSEYVFEGESYGGEELRAAANGGKFIYLEDGRCYAVGELGSVKVDADEGVDNGNSVVRIDEYQEIDPVRLDAVRDHLTILIPTEEPIIEIEEADYELIRYGEVWRKRILSLLEKESHQAALYRQSLAHLVAGKNLLFYGPPGTGKTRAAKLLTNAVCADYRLVTANAEWSNHQVVGGYRPAGKGWDTEAGFLTKTAIDCRRSIDQVGEPTWLLIDEINRANLDQAFGEVFTLLDIDYREQVPLSFADTDEPVPLAFRIIGTMNTYDQAQLFSLGYAFRRRFAFVHVPSLLESQDLPETTTNNYLSDAKKELSKESEYVVELLADTIPGDFQVTADEGTSAADTGVVFAELANDPAEKLADLRNNEELCTDEFDLLETLTYFAQIATENDVIDIGQALLLDAARFILAHELLFAGETTRETLDQAVVSYLVPQFEQFMSELRRAETIGNSNAVERFENVIAVAEELQLPRTAKILSEAKETKQVLES
ncbi:AAA family ATPase [Haloferax chudinovii]|uniref:AAA family ATPase n=1 Tax=Haloferax chudinovii TaxID=1109010 RepID=A0ABD5XH51_9EURY